jgi:hypothetical protein
VRALQLKAFDKFLAARRKILHAEAHGTWSSGKAMLSKVNVVFVVIAGRQNVLFLPCGHLSSCHLCVSSLWARRLFDDLEFLCTNCQTAVDSVASRSRKDLNASPILFFIWRDSRYLARSKSIAIFNGADGGDALKYSTKLILSKNLHVLSVKTS